jgi:hypothetical protein
MHTWAAELCSRHPAHISTAVTAAMARLSKCRVYDWTAVASQQSSRSQSCQHCSLKYAASLVLSELTESRQVCKCLRRPAERRANDMIKT